MEIGDRVKIEGTQSIWDGKEGILEELLEDKDMAVVFVDFIPNEGKKVRQNFALENIFPLDQPNILGEGKNFVTSQIIKFKK